MTNNKKWKLPQVYSLFEKPFLQLLFQAQTIHNQNFSIGEIQISTLLSIKTGSCPEDCKYCSQSSRYRTGILKENLIELEKVFESAKIAKRSGATRFCMGAAWRKLKDKDIPLLSEMIKGVKKMGMETCMTLGTLNEKQAKKLARAGLDFYNHNLDTSPEFYKNIVTTRSYQERLDTIQAVQREGIKVCSGGILGLGESMIDRANLLIQLANLPKPPESVPINMLVRIKGTPMYDNAEIDPFDFIRTIAVARIMMPSSYIRLSAGREKMSEQTQALCFIAGANSIFYGKKLLTAPNPLEESDEKLFRKLGIHAERSLYIRNNKDHNFERERLKIEKDKIVG